MIKPLYIFTTLLAASTLSLQAGEINDFTLKGVALPAGPILDTITIDGSLYDATNLVNGTMTGVTDSGQVQLMAGSGASSVPAVGSRDTVLSDLRLDTAILNINQVVFTFDQAIVNTGTSKIDFVMFDWGGFSDDTFNLTINGTEFLGLSDASVSPGGDFHSESASLSSNWFATPSSDGISTVSELNNIVFSTSSNSSSGGSQGAIGIDLSHFGVAVGESITQITITDTGTVSVDPSLILGVQAIPEPSSVFMLGVGLACMIFLGAKKRR